MKHKLIFKKTFRDVISTAFWHFIGACVNRIIIAYEVHQRRSSELYKNTYSRLPLNLLQERNRYVDVGGLEYKEVDDLIVNKETISQYYLYKHVIGKDSQVKVCNVGAFNCSADYNYLMSNDKATVYALDFGNMEKLNSEFLSERLILRSGYPLEVLEDILATEGEMFFDYTIFTRTAVLFNKNELNSYMEVISRISKKVAFFEVVDFSNITSINTDLNSIEINNPLKMYSGMYIHNYSKVVENFGYEVSHVDLIPPGTFPNESSNGHHMICVVGEKIVN